MNQPTNDNPAEPLMDQTGLLFETNPYGTLDAIVQHDGRAVYFYLNGRDASNPFGTRACWVRNLQLGPMVLNDDEMASGVAPLLPRTQCKNRDPGKIPDAENLKIVWLEEGNGAALLERTISDPSSTGNWNTLAIIPPWSGHEGFQGYAAECATESPLCWPMPDNPNLHQRVVRAAEFWDSFTEAPDPFSQWQPKILSTYDQHFLSDPDCLQPKYYSIDGGKFPPRGLVHYRSSKRHVFATVAMSLCPQPMVEIFNEQPVLHRRVELAIELNPDWDESKSKKVAGLLSTLAGYPWRHLNWFGAGHTCQFAGIFPGVETALLVHDTQLKNRTAIELPEYRGDPVNLLWLQPSPQES